MGPALSPSFPGLCQRERCCRKLVSALEKQERPGHPLAHTCSHNCRCTFSRAGLGVESQGIIVAVLSSTALNSDLWPMQSPLWPVASRSGPPGMVPDMSEEEWWCGPMYSHIQTTTWAQDLPRSGNRPSALLAQLWPTHHGLWLSVLTGGLNTPLPLGSSGFTCLLSWVFEGCPRNLELKQETPFWGQTSQSARCLNFLMSKTGG